MSLVLERALEQPVEQVRPMRAPSQYSPAWATLLVALDALVFAGSATASAFIVFHRVDTLFVPRDGVFWATAAFIGIWLLIFARVGLYRRSFALSVKDEFYFIAAALSMGVVPLLAFFTLWPAVSTSRLHILLTLAMLVRGRIGRAHGGACRAQRRHPQPAAPGRDRRSRIAHRHRHGVAQSRRRLASVAPRGGHDLDSTLSPVDLSVDPRCRWHRVVRTRESVGRRSRSS